MQQLAKECLEIHEKIKQLSPTRQDKGDKLAADIKSQLLNVLGEDFNDIGVWCNCGDSFLEIFINVPVTEDYNDYLVLRPLADGKGWVIENDKKCRYEKLIACAQSIVDKLNGKE